MDYLYIGEGINQNKYVLVLKDDLSSYTRLIASPDATAETAAEALMSWIASFGSMQWITTDQGPHFKNVVMETVIKELQVQHNFTTTYSPWPNGTVERACREVIRACRVLCSERKLSEKDWASIIEVVQSIFKSCSFKDAWEKFSLKFI